MAFDLDGELTGGSRDVCMLVTRRVFCASLLFAGIYFGAYQNILLNLPIVLVTVQTTTTRR